MGKKKRKSPHCTNCNYSFSNAFSNNFCPNCGQENTNNTVSLWYLFKDFFDTYFSIDSKIWRTIRHLFIPGLVTASFINGKRVSYYSPIRVYFTSSIIYFAVFSFILFSNEDLKEGVPISFNFNNNNNTEAEVTEQDSLKTVDTLQVKEIETEPEKPIPESKENDEEDDDDDGAILDLNFGDSSDGYWSTLSKLIPISREKGLDFAMDSLKTKHPDQLESWFQVLATRQFLKIGNSDSKSFIGYMLGICPLLLFAFIPLLAFFFKILYIRRKKLFVEHTVFFLHFYSFLFLLLTLLFAIFQLQNPVIFITSIVMFVYTLMAMKKVYQQSWIKTTLKCLMLVFSYPFFVLLFLIGGLGVSFFFF